MTASKAPRLVQALIPIGFLVLALGSSVWWFGEDSSYGPNQIALMLAGCLALLLGWRNGLSWRALEKDVYGSMMVVFAPIFILLAVGMMIAAWQAGGIVPALIWYGLKLLHPGVFYAAACLVCALVSLSIGSSWTTAASVGVALIGTAAGLGLAVEITAGAVVSGAYFGDKMSPLSDTTNLASAVADVDLFNHIRHMAWTGVPSLLLALVLFLLLGLRAEPASDALTLAATLALLEQQFSIGLHMLLPLALLLFLAWRRMPALPALLIATATGLVYAVLFQDSLGTSEQGLLPSLWLLTVEGVIASTGDPVLDELLSGGGAANMLNTVWLILSAVFFGTAMEKTGLLARLLEIILRHATGTAALITSTVLTCIGTNVITGDQYIAIVLPGRMYKVAFRRQGLSALNLSRALEDAGTVTSPLIPWNTCGAFMAATLGVSTLAYLPFCFFNLAMPAISILFGVIGFRILPLEAESAPSAGLG